MELRTVVTAAIAAGAMAGVAAPEAASALNLNQWYGGSFYSPAPSPLVAGGGIFYLGTNGPVLPGGFANAIATTSTPWTFNLPFEGRLTVTDQERAGDIFELYDNGVLMTPAPGIFHGPGQNPGQAARAGGLTSLSVTNGDYVYGNINAALGDAAFSSGTFWLSPGVNNITGVWLAQNNQGTGDMSFIAESGVPEPTTWAMMLVGFAGLGFAGYRKARASTSIA